MKKAYLVVLVLYFLIGLGLTAWFFVQFPPYPGPPASVPETAFRVKAALAGGFLVALPAWFAVGEAYSGVERWRDRRRLTPAAAGSRRVDGKRGVFFGTVRRDGPPLAAPLTRRDCLLYRYEMVSHMGTRRTETYTSLIGRGIRYEDTPSVTLAEGFALTPCSIETASGPVKLLTLVKPQFEPDRLALEDVAENFEAYLAAAKRQGVGSLDGNSNLQRSLAKRPKASIRYDLGNGKVPQKPPRAITEHLVQDGDTVAVIGKYSQAAGGIVPDSGSSSSTDLYKGTFDTIARALGLKAFRSLVSASFWGVVAAVGAWAFFAFGPTHLWD